eukprot:gb/GEZN01006624.1/.p1 GENE.gb/GEZN01006624.1/~~gb/GEZN01006624.1/.p1  ORF type:complete len:475 (-),score=87.59 gb/GEZN01006624.1/:212-1429(-)
MVDATVEEYGKIYGGEEKIPEDLQKKCAEKRTNVVKQLKAQKKACTPMLNALSNSEVQSQIRSVLTTESDGPERMASTFSTAASSIPQITLKMLQEHVPEIKEDHVEALYSFAKLKYECGYYKEAVNMLTFYMKTTQADEAKKFQALWGKVAAEILCVQMEQAFKDIKLLNFWIDERQSEDQHVQLERRMWLIHWSLFLLFALKEESDRVACLHFLLKDRLFNTIQVSCPHVLRYLTASMVVLRGETEYKDKAFHEFLRVLKREESHYSDPLTKFLLHLYVEFDYENIPAILKECELVMKSDHFLHRVVGDFMKRARILFFEAYCRLHQCIDIRLLAKQMDIKDDIEQTIIDFIQETGVTAKVDSSKNQLVILRRPTSIYQKVVERTKRVSYSTNMLVDGLRSKK